MFPNRRIPMVVCSENSFDAVFPCFLQRGRFSPSHSLIALSSLAATAVFCEPCCLFVVWVAPVVPTLRSHTSVQFAVYPYAHPIGPPRPSEINLRYFGIAFDPATVEKESVLLVLRCARCCDIRILLAMQRTSFEPSRCGSEHVVRCPLYIAVLIILTAFSRCRHRSYPGFR